MKEIKFVNGLYFKKSHENAPDFAIGKLSAKREELIAFLQEQEGEWVNMEIKESKKGAIYIAVDDWKPKKEEPLINEKTGGTVPF